MNLKNRSRSFLPSAMLVLVCIFLFSSFANARERLIIIGTATASGLFYPIGVELCKIINKDYLEKGIRCIATTSGGAEYNLMALRTGEIDIALATSYASATSYSGVGTFAQYGPDKTLRQVARLYSTPITFVVARGKVASLDDIKWKNFNLGNRGGAKRSIAEMVFRTSGWSEAELKHTRQLDLTDDLVVNEFCKGNIDGFTMITGMPSPLYDRVLSKCNGEILEIPEELIKKIITKNPSLSETVIPPGAYNRSSKGIHTLALDSTVMASTNTPFENVELVHAALRDNMQSLISSFEALKECNVSPEYFKTTTIPVHEALTE